MIRYPQSRAKDWDIGSGPTQALCKTTAARLKGSGMRWDPAEHWMHLRTTNPIESTFATVRLRHRRTILPCPSRAVTLLNFLWICKPN